MTKTNKARRYAPEYIDKAIDGLQVEFHKYDDVSVDEIAPAISDGNNKIGRTLNLSWASGLSCGNCTLCKYDGCYDLCDCVAHPNTVIPARARNLAILRKNPDALFEAFEARMNDRRKIHVGRFAVGGEWENGDMITSANDVAERHPDWPLWTYTKMHGLWNRWLETHTLAANFSPMFSRWGLGHIIDNPYGVPEFLTLLEGEHKPAGYMWCPGNCEHCIENKIGCPYGMNVANPLHGLPRLD